MTQKFNLSKKCCRNCGIFKKFVNNTHFRRKRSHPIKKHPSNFSNFDIPLAWLKKDKQIIDEYIELGHSRLTNLRMKKFNSENKYFIAHLCITREETSSTKSSITSSGCSLNYIAFKGYQVQSFFYDILCRFIFIQKILWINNPNDPLHAFNY